MSEQPFLHDDASYLTALSVSPVDTDRFIAINDKAVLYYSADGIHWGNRIAQTGPVGDRSTAFYNPFRDVWEDPGRLHL